MDSEKVKNQTKEQVFSVLGASAEGLTSDGCAKRLEQFGYNTIEEKKKSLVLQFLSFFWGPIPLMISMAGALSALLAHWADFTIIAVLLIFNACVGFWQQFQADRAIAVLKQKLASTARVLRDGTWQVVEAALLVPGDVIRLRLGDVVPADGKLIEGSYLSIDQAALTGESLPVNKGEGAVVYSGSIVRQGEMVALVTGTGSDTFFGKTAKLVTEAKSESHFEKAVMQMGDYLIYLSLSLVALLFIVQWERGDSLMELAQFSLILIVASIPVAMPAVLSVTMAVGALALSKMKAIVTRLDAIEEMAGMEILCTDKTGTMTQNRLTLGEGVPWKDVSNSELVLWAALASKEENEDLIDLAVIHGLADPALLKEYEQVSFVPFDPVGKRTEATVQRNTGEHVTCTKGAPQIVLSLCSLGGEERKQVQQEVDRCAKKGWRTLGVAKKEEGKTWQFLGLLSLSDPLREDSVQTVAEAKAHGLRVKMVTGDNLAIAREVSSQLGLGTHILNTDEMENASANEVEEASGFAQVFPEHKFSIVKEFQAQGKIVGMTGDGVNDAPALKQADVGIAVSGATDAAKEAASLVLTNPGLSVIIRAIEEARRIFERMNSYAIYRICETVRILFFIALTMLVYNFYPLTAMMIIFLALLNDLPILTIAYDRTWLDPLPVRWQMKRVLTLSTALGLLGVIETFALLVIAKSVFGISDERLQSILFLKLVLAGHLTLFVARSKHAFFKKPFPAPILLTAILFTQLIAIALVAFGLFVPAISWEAIGAVWLYCLFWLFIEDAVKVLLYRHLEGKSTRHRTFFSFLSAPLRR